MFSTKQMLKPIVTSVRRMATTDARVLDLKPIKPRFDLTAMRLDKNTTRAIAGVLHYFHSPKDYIKKRPNRAQRDLITRCSWHG